MEDLKNEIIKKYSFVDSSATDFNSHFFSSHDINYNKYIENLIASGVFNYFLNEYLFQNYDGMNLMTVLNEFFDIIDYHPNLSVAKRIVLKSSDLQRLFNCWEGKLDDSSTASILYSGFCEILGDNIELVKTNSNRSEPLFFEREGIFEQIKSGNLEARNAFLLQNLGLVKKVVYAFTSDSDLYDDYYQVGCMGLISAVDNFDFTKGYKFSTYAYRCIINSLYKYYGNTSYSFSVPLNIHDLICKYKKLSHQYGSRGEMIKDDEACDILGIDSKTLKFIKEDYHAVSIYSPFNRCYASCNDGVVDGELLSIAENIPSEVDIADRVEAKLLSEEIDRIINETNLTDRERMCLINYFGFDQKSKKGVDGICRRTYYYYKERALKKISDNKDIMNLADFVGISPKTMKKVK